MSLPIEVLVREVWFMEQRPDDRWAHCGMFPLALAPRL
jgi:hypothetical protein